jgi:hypothetical protein
MFFLQIDLKINEILNSFQNENQSILNLYWERVAVAIVDQIEKE